MSTERPVRELVRGCREAAVVGMLAALAGVVFNAARPGGLPLVATAPYETLVPCPEPGGEVAAAIAAGAPPARARAAAIAARAAGGLDAAHVPGAVSVPYDWLDPTPDGKLAELARTIAGSGATRVFVYGDGGRPDSGEYLAREISGRGIKNVSFVRGGAPALLGGGGR